MITIQYFYAFMLLSNIPETVVNFCRKKLFGSLVMMFTMIFSFFLLQFFLKLL